MEIQKQTMRIIRANESQAKDQIKKLRRKIEWEEKSIGQIRLILLAKNVEVILTAVGRAGVGEGVSYR